MSNRIKIFFFSVLCLTIVAASINSCYYDNEEYLYSSGACTDTTYSYTGRIKAIVDQNCASSSCHAGPSPANSIALETFAQVKDNVQNGRFMCSIYWTSSCSQMPKNGAKLDACSILAIEKWKDKGFPEN